MKTYLEMQYGAVCESRAVVTRAIAQLSAIAVNTKIQCFNYRSISYLLAHVHNVYGYWVGNFALNMNVIEVREHSIQSFVDVQDINRETNLLMQAFFEKYNCSWEHEITGILHGETRTFSALDIFTHVITHEFHHKGQLMSMYRLLGKVPPDTDIIRT